MGFLTRVRLGLALAAELGECAEVVRAFWRDRASFALRVFMAGRLGRGRCLIFGLVLCVGAAAFSCLSHAEPLPGGTRTAQTAPHAVPVPAQSHPATLAARNSQGNCSFPWTYSEGARGCVCEREGYTLRHGNCLRAEITTAVVTPETEPAPAAEHRDKKAEDDRVGAALLRPARLLQGADRRQGERGRPGPPIGTSRTTTG